MIRMTSGMAGAGTGRATAVMEHMNSPSMSVEDRRQMLLEKYSKTNKADDEGAETVKHMQDRFERSRDIMAETFESYTATGVKRRFVGGQLYR